MGEAHQFPLLHEQVQVDVQGGQIRQDLAHLLHHVDTRVIQLIFSDGQVLHAPQPELTRR